MNILELNLFLLIINTLIFLVVIKNIIKIKFINVIFIVIVSGQLIIFNGLRNTNVGIDTIRYYKNFKKIEFHNNYYDYECGYKLLQIIFFKFSDNFNLFLLFLSIIMFLILAIIIKKFSKCYFLSYLLFICLGFYNFSFTGIRQSLSMIIILISYKYILNKNFKKFLVICIISMLFHSSSMIFIPVYFIANMKWKRINLIFMLVLYLLAYIFKLQIGNLLTIMYYENPESVLQKYESSNYIGNLAIFIAIIIIIGRVIYNPLIYDKRENIVLNNIMIIALFVQFISSFSYLFTRLNMYYLLFIILYIPNFLNNTNKFPLKLNLFEAKVFKYVLKLIISVVMILYYLNTLKTNSYGIFPYTFFW